MFGLGFEWSSNQEMLGNNVFGLDFEWSSNQEILDNNGIGLWVKNHSKPHFYCKSRDKFCVILFKFCTENPVIFRKCLAGFVDLKYKPAVRPRRNAFLNGPGHPDEQKHFYMLQLSWKCRYCCQKLKYKPF